LAGHPKDTQASFQGAGVDADIQPVVAAFDRKTGTLARRDDAGLAAVDGHLVPADGRFAFAGHGRQQAEAIAFRIVDERAEIAGAVDKPEILKLNQVSHRPEAGAMFDIGPDCAEPGQQGIPEFVGVRGSEDRISLQRRAGEAMVW
jgi:hypothetical protein